MHPLLRAAAYGQLMPARRRQLHQRLAETVGDVEQRAHHLARATHRPDEAVAAAIEEGAERAKARGAPAVAAELLDRAIELTEAEELRVRRVLDATTGRPRPVRWTARAPRSKLSSLISRRGSCGQKFSRCSSTTSASRSARPWRSQRRGWRGRDRHSDPSAAAARAQRHGLPAERHPPERRACARSARNCGNCGRRGAARTRDVVERPAREPDRERRSDRLLRSCTPARTASSGIDPWHSAGHWQGVSLMWADRVSERARCSRSNTSARSTRKRGCSRWPLLPPDPARMPCGQLLACEPLCPRRPRPGRPQRQRPARRHPPQRARARGGTRR